MTGYPEPPGGYVLAIALAVALIAANALFVMAEYALVRVRPARLQDLAQRGSSRAALAHALVRRLDESISICQVGITLCGLGLGYLAEPAVASLLGLAFGRLLAPVAAALGPFANTVTLVVSFLVVTVFLVVLGELLPKRLTIAATERVALATALPLRLFGLFAWPLVWLLNNAADLLVRLLGLGRIEESGHSREEIQQLLFMSARKGELGTMEFRLLENLFRFAKRRARDAMVPRNRVVALDVTRPPSEIAARARAEGYSRYPLVEGDLDHVAGILHVKDLGPAEASAADLRRLARPPLIIPDTLPLESLLRQFQSERAHLAVVADEYGAVVGIVTLEDVLEELVGELRDEFDAEEQDAVRQRPGGGWVLDPALPLDRAVELVTDPPELPEGVHTIAGLLQSELGRIPEPGERVPFGPGHDLVAAAVQGTRVLRVELVPRA